MQPTQATRRTVLPGFQILWIIASTLVIGLGLYKNLDTFQTRDTHLPLVPVRQSVLHDQNTSPTIIEMGLHINQFDHFNITQNNFILDAIVWFVVPQDSFIEYLDDFEFERGTIIKQSEPHIKKIGRDHLVQYDIKVAFRAPLNYSHFPLDDHRLFLLIKHAYFEPKDIIFSSSDENFKVPDNVNKHGWRMVNKDVTTGYIDATLDKSDLRKSRQYTAALFSIDLARGARRYVVTLLLPLLFLFYLGLMSLSVSSEAGLALSTGALTGTLGYRFVIEKLSPSFGYFMFSDYSFFFFLAATFLIFLCNLIDLYGKPIKAIHKKIIISLLHCMIIVSSIYFLVFWV